MNAGREAEDLTIAADTIYKVMARLRAKHEDLTALQVMCLMRVASKPGISQRSIQKELAAGANSTASRILGILSDVGARGTKGLELIEMRVNPMDRRERLVYLSPKGKKLMTDIAKDLAKAYHDGKATA
jgi:DNA-binding MarR family transcriptional regulator